MKILQINASYKPAYIYGGPTMSVAKLCEQLVNAGNSVTVFTTTANGKDELPVMANKTIIVDGVEVIYFKRNTKDHSHFSPALLTRLWKDAPKFDVIHIHAWWNLVSVLSAFIAVSRNVPVIISPRGTLSSYSFTNKNNLAKKLLHNLLGKRLLRQSYLHATSNAELKNLAEIITPKGMFDIPNFVKIAPSSIPKKPSGKVLKLLFFSRIEEKKGLDILLHALPLLTIPYHLTIAGDGDNAYIDLLKNIARYNQSESNISWIGFQNENKFDVFVDHDLLVLPSYNENFGNVVIESLSAGTPVLISEQVGLANYVVKNELGWLCETTPRSISDAINDIATTKTDRLAQISLDAPGIIHRDFDEDQLIKKYIDMYQQVINHV
ncbi:glycosyltransferase [Mucilaginibacter corticis]|uniref:Glycosyltransferase n=1 Tax=Mucilaginibacter corticis TaxID=2597670 RepID=A0A556M7U2_9SPHI|nr:glycosyltransferase [Mucilaginibacter corticis]TSJ35981.1 glycosyltransferase [Mucilaginibacter corticis]